MAETIMGMDPKKFQTLSQFMTGAGQTMFKLGSTPGVSPLTGIMAGLGGGGQQVAAYQSNEVKRALLSLQKKQAEQDLEQQDRMKEIGIEYAKGLPPDHPALPVFEAGLFKQALDIVKEKRLGEALDLGTDRRLLLTQDWGPFKMGDPVQGVLNMKTNLYTVTTPDGKTHNVPSSVVEATSLQGGRDAVGGLTKGDLSQSRVTGAGATSDIASAASLRIRMEAAGPGVVGFRMMFSEPVTGFLGQVNEKLGRWASKTITGVEPEEATAIRIEARSVVVGLITPLTGEESGRITQRELEIATQAAKIVNDASSSLAEVRGALATVIKLNLTVLDKETLMRGETPMFDLDSDSGIEEAANVLKETLRMSEDETVDILSSMIRQRLVMRNIGGFGQPK
jgi:hypothetical protein